MWEESCGPILLLVEHRSLDGDGGPCLRVRTTEEPGRELLRFDCFERTPHFHVDPDGRDELTPVDPLDDPVGFATGELRRDLEGYLKRAGLEIDRPLPREEVREAIDRAEAQMRNPPVDLDALDVGVLQARTGEKWALYPRDVIPAWVADMDFPVADPIRRVLHRAVERSDVGYPLDPDRVGLREAFAERMESRYGWTVPVERIAVITDVVQGIYVALEVYANRGDGIVIQTPIYPPFLHAVADTGRRLVENPLRRTERGYEVDVEGLRSRVDRTTRVLLLSNPHNPSGRVFTRGELEAMAEIAIERDLVIVSDEIHQDLVLPGSTHVPMATLGPEIEARTVTLTSATKAFSIAGLRCAVVAFGSDALRERFQSIPRHVLGGAGTLGLQATLEAWRHCGPWLDRVLSHLAAGRDHVARFVRERLPGAVHVPPEATYLAWIDCRDLGVGANPSRFFLKEAKVALSDGRLFGEPGRGFVRLNFATARPILDEVLSRMADAVERGGTGRG